MGPNKIFFICPVTNSEFVEFVGIMAKWINAVNLFSLDST